MRILGINALNHDAAVSVIEDGNIKFAAHSERYSRVKNDMFLNDYIMDEALSHGEPDVVAYFERPWLRKLVNYMLDNTMKYFKKRIHQKNI